MPIARTPTALHPFWMGLTKSQREQLAAKVDCTPGHLKMVALGHNNISAGLARKLDEATCGLVRKEDMRPDVYA